MTDVREIQAENYNKALASALSDLDEFKAPEWVFFVKSSTHKMRPIGSPEFWHKRAASILRQFYLHGSVGVQRLRTRYGGKKNRGKKPEEFRKGAGKIIRVILQQAESADLLEKTGDEKSVRKLSEKGKKFLESVAEKASKESNKEGETK